MPPYTRFGFSPQAILRPCGAPGNFMACMVVAGRVAQRDAAAADQVGRTGQHLQRGHAAGERGLEARILRPHAVLGPDAGGHRVGHLVAVLVGFHARARVHAEVRVHVDEAGRHPATLRVDHRGAVGGEARADRDDLAVAHQHVGAVEASAGAVEHGGVADQCRGRGERLVGRRVRVLRRDGATGPGRDRGQPASCSFHLEFPRSPARRAPKLPPRIAGCPEAAPPCSATGGVE